jgi:hypothetical protein
MTTTLSDLSPATVQRLSDAIRLLAEVHNKRFSDAAITVWCKRLAEYANGSALWRAMSAACEEDRMPSLHRLVELMRGRPETKLYQAMQPPTPEQKAKADKAAVLSLLWLHYAKGWELERVGAETIGRLVAGRLDYPPEDLPRILAEAKEHYPRTLVMAWMENEQREGR